MTSEESRAKRLANLKPFNTLSSEEARIRGINGVKKREENRKKRAIFREEFEKQLSNGDTLEKIVKNLILKAEKSDNPEKAMEIIRDTIGQKPVERTINVDVSATDLEEVEKLFEDL